MQLYKSRQGEIFLNRDGNKAHEVEDYLFSIPKTVIISPTQIFETCLAVADLEGVVL